MLTDEDRKALEAHLERSAQLFRDAISGLSAAQWSFEPGGGSWSIAEIAEHVAITEASILERICGSLLHSPADPDFMARARQKDRVLEERIPVRTSKAQAPDAARPLRRWATPAEAQAVFDQGRDRTLRYVLDTQDDLRGHAEAHAALKLLDGYQWLLMIALHTERHVAQIEAVKTASGYPKHA